MGYKQEASEGTRGPCGSALLDISMGCTSMVMGDVKC